MAIPEGTKLGRYEIRSILGSGGMGEVYLADDLHLRRRVAIKVLRSGLTTNEDRLRRFELEAFAASSLNHPNILTIHEFGSENEDHFIVSEFVDGVSLGEHLRAEHLRREPLQLHRVLEIGIQVASALAAAHAAGIVHRDIKSDNIMLRRDHLVKVLDFGLAKLSETESVGLDTVVMDKAVPLTVPGMVMGTARYMSPEQARGLPVDARTDIWSLGVVLYEMVTNHQPFTGKTMSDVIAAVLTVHPPLLSTYRTGVPDELERIISKALRKNEEERYQVVKDLELDLKSLKQRLEFEKELERSGAGRKSGEERSGAGPEQRHTAQTLIAVSKDRTADPPHAASVRDTSPTFLPTRTASAEYPVSRMKHWKALVIAVCVLIVTAAGIGYWLLRYNQQRRFVNVFQRPRITQITSGESTIHAAISPDGKNVAHVESNIGQQSLWIKQVNAANDIQIVPPMRGGFFGLTFSPDGNHLYYVFNPSGGGVLYRIPVLGGIPTKLLLDIESPVTFSPDGKRLAFVRGGYSTKGESALVIANADGTGAQALAARKLPESFSPLYFAGPSWSPDGELIASPLVNDEGGRHVDLKIFHVNDGTAQTLNSQRLFHIGRVQWLPDSSGLFMIAGDRNEGRAQVRYISYPDGEIRNITNDLNGYRDLSLTADATKLLTVQMSARFTVWSMPANDSSRATQVNSGRASVSNISWTPDGKIVFSSIESGTQEIWITDADGANRKQLTHTAGKNFDPTVSRDGRYIVFSSNRTGKVNIWRIDINGHNPLRLTNGLSEESPGVSPDGRWLVYSSSDLGKPGVWKTSIDGGEPVRLTEYGLNAQVSPDGKLVACQYRPDPTQSGQDSPAKLAVIPFDGGPPIITFDFQNAVSSSATPSIHWSADGRAVLYASTLNNVSNIWSQPIDGGKPTQVTAFQDSQVLAFDISADGKLIVASRGMLIRNAVLISESQ